MFRYLFVFIWANFALADDSVRYEFSLENAAQQMGRVTIQLPQIESTEVILKLPVWRSGRYEILNLSKNISQFSAQSVDGQSLRWQKQDKNTWAIHNPGQQAVEVSYLVYANMLSYRVAHIDESHAFLDASGVFMFSPALRDLPLSVEMRVPSDWRSISGMSSPQDHVFVADNYDQLVDSPIESGVHEFLAFEVDDRHYEIVIWGEGNHDISDLRNKIELLDGVAQDLWGDFPFQRYVYMYHVGEGLRGATEHVNSTIIQSNRFQFKPESDYHKVLATTAHEFVHTWNVKSYRPAGIAPYDYSDENYSKLFWMVEGSTSYYDDLFLMRAGIYQPQDFFKRLSDNIHGHLDKPGRDVSSVAMSSFDTWMKNDPHFTLNNRVSIYQEGALKTWALDQAIRAASDHKFNYDDVQRQLYQAHIDSNLGYSESDVKAILTELTGSPMAEFWRAYVDGTEPIDFDALLDYYGLQRVFDVDSQETVWMGLEVTSDGTDLIVKAVHRNSPAWQAGITVGDTVLALDGHRVKAKDWSDHLSLLMAGETYNLSYFSGDQLKNTNVNPVKNPNPEFIIVPVEKPSRQQKQVFKDWTGVDLPD